jgi:hypothetical protein
MPFGNVILTKACDLYARTLFLFSLTYLIFLSSRCSFGSIEPIGTRLFSVHKHFDLNEIFSIVAKPEYKSFSCVPTNSVSVGLF